MKYIFVKKIRKKDNILKILNYSITNDFDNFFLAPDVDELLCSSKYVQSSTIRKEKIQQRHRLDDEDMNIWNN